MPVSAVHTSRPFRAQPDAALPDAAPPPTDPGCDLEFELLAHGRALPGDDTPYAVPATPEHFVTFTFQVPWPGAAQGVSFRPVIEAGHGVEEVRLYTAPRGGRQSDGQITPGIGALAGHSMVASAGRRGQAAVLPDDVGMELPDGPDWTFVLQIHYSGDAGDMNVQDRSGMHVCATTTRRPHTAAMYTLGTEVIAGVGNGELRFTGICTPEFGPPGPVAPEPVHILTSAPRMRSHGRSLTTLIHRADGVTVDTLLNTPVNFLNPIIHPTPETLYPGDWLSTTCTFQGDGNGFVFGPRSQDEECVNAITVWPVGPLDTGGSLMNEVHACML